MSERGSITQLIADLKQGEGATLAQMELWNRYFHRVVALARRKLEGVHRAAENEEDVAVSVLKSLFLRIGDDRLPLLRDRQNLWPLLVKITACKAVNLRKRTNAAKRGGGKPAHLLGHSRGPGGATTAHDIDAVVAKDPTPQFAALLAEQYQRLLAALPHSLRLVAQRKIEGYSNAEIATELAVVPRTIERKLKLIRQVWESMEDDVDLN